MAEFGHFPKWDGQLPTCLSDRLKYVAGAVTSFERSESDSTQRKVIRIGFPGSCAWLSHISRSATRVPVATIAHRIFETAIRPILKHFAWIGTVLEVSGTCPLHDCEIADARTFEFADMNSKTLAIFPKRETQPIEGGAFSMVQCADISTISNARGNLQQSDFGFCLNKPQSLEGMRLPARGIAPACCP